MHKQLQMELLKKQIKNDRNKQFTIEQAQELFDIREVEIKTMNQKE